MAVLEDPALDLDQWAFRARAGLAAALLLLVPFAYWLAGARYERLRDFQLGLGYGTVSGLRKLDFYHSTAWPWRWSLLAYSAVFVLLPLACYWFRRALWLPALAGALACVACYRWSWSPQLPTLATLFFTAIPVLAPVCVALNRSWPHRRLLLLLVWAPSVLSMLAVTYSSGNGWFATSLGALGALVAASQRSARCSRPAPGRTRRRVWAINSC